MRYKPMWIIEMPRTLSRADKAEVVAILKIPRTKDLPHGVRLIGTRDWTCSSCKTHEDYHPNGEPCSGCGAQP